MKTLLISGISGRMGREIRQLAASYGFASRTFTPSASGDVIVDFSHPDCLDSLLSSALPLVIGTTGYTAAQQRAIEAAAGARPIFQAANFSPGVFALNRLARQAKAMLPDWDVCLIERHHAQKRDIPSGTGLALARALQTENVLSVRGGTVCGVHEAGLYGPEEHLLLTHTAESRAVFARGALKAAAWLTDQPCGLYHMEDIMLSQEKTHVD